MAPNAPEAATPSTVHVQPLLFTPLKIGRVTVKNRICIAAMCMYSADDGFVSEWHRVHLGARAIGGAGMVMVEATAVEPRGRISKYCPGIWKDEHIPKLKEITDFMKSQNCVPAIQLAHSGRKGSTMPPWVGRGKAVAFEDGGWQTIAPSPIAFGNGNDRVPLEASIEDIQQLKQDFVDASLRAIEAGFEVIELHMAHGYLGHSFLSPHSNKRQDAYGGDFEGRTRFSVEMVKEVKAALPEDYPLLVRISCDDYLPEGEGWDLDQSIRLSRIFKQLGVHLVDCSSGGNVNFSTKMFAYNNVDQVSQAARIQAEADIPTGAVGGIVSARWAEKILQKKKATMIFLARVSLDDPNWPMHAAFELGAEHVIPNQYLWSISSKTVGSWRQTVLADRNQKELDREEEEDSN